MSSKPRLSESEVKKLRNEIQIINGKIKAVRLTM
jgi:hypothetical protein